MSRRLTGTPSSLLEIVWKNCLGGMYGFGVSARPPARFRWWPAGATGRPMNRIGPDCMQLLTFHRRKNFAMNAASEPSCGLWRESRQKSRGVLYGKTLFH
ncbi:hypothetical protein [Paraburkholderia acidisoli]|uniref:hypothetical protein n=1 Tax=Paraburkholderia acidisoli TaxID=2571748 RepID=UPI0018EECDAA|nr:hypothetical protein [Paraburkholderia acidisoli]